MAKGNIRSIRFSDELLALIEAQPGDTFTAKYEGLIRRCVAELPETKKQLAAVQAQIQNERNYLRNLREKRQKLEFSIQGLETAFNQIRYQVNRNVKALEEL